MWLKCRVLGKGKAAVRMGNECRKVGPNFGKGYTRDQVVSGLRGVICTTVVGELGCLGFS